MSFQVAPDEVIRKYVWELKNLAGARGPLGQRKAIVEIKWERPTKEWIKLNFDGAMKSGTGLLGGGGVLRNSEREWIGGHMKKIGVCVELI